MNKRQLLVIFILITVCFTLVELEEKPKNKPKKKCKLRRCKRPVYNVLGTKIGCKAGLRYLRCIRRMIKRCPAYKNMFTKESWADFKELMEDAKATYKQAGARCRIGPRPNGDISGLRTPLQTIFIESCILLTLIDRITLQHML